MEEAINELPVVLDEGATMPNRAHKWDAGLDFAANEDAVIPPHGTASVGTGVHVGIPQGCAGILVPRSSMGFKRDMGFTNGFGLIDSGYTGEVRASICNWRDEPQRIAKGERIAQLVVVPVALLEPVLVERLGETERGDGGFGSTGR